MTIQVQLFGQAILQAGTARVACWEFIKKFEQRSYFAVYPVSAMPACVLKECNDHGIT